MERIDLGEALDAFDSHWDPKIVAELNGQHVKLVKLLGEFVWHHHMAEDELFLVLAGTLRIEFRDRSVALGPGQMLVVPRGVEHRPVAEDEVHVLLFEPAGTLKTGDVWNEMTVEDPERL